jgi:phenylpropionate dioxygenase-like ring-hydroxylating dioxygenase large terminal subunit
MHYIDPMRFTDFWYVVAASADLPAGRVLARRVLGERLACFRGADGRATVLRDRCLHRNAPLSAGCVRDGVLVCPYHGWHYDGDGNVTHIPSQPDSAGEGHRLPPFAVREIDGYVYVRLDADAPAAIAPWRMHHFGERGYRHVRLVNRFEATVTNCVENFIDVPHTAFVHAGIFRSTRGERIAADVLRANGAVSVVYHNERANLGTWRWFLNPRGHEIRHVDRFVVPNVTCVTYEIGERTFIITSQSVPTGEDDGGETIVYTDLTYDFGLFNDVARPWVRRYGQRVIDQDVAILAAQMDNLRRYGAEFRDTPADTIHRCVESLREALARGEDPHALSPLTRRIEFCV